METEEGNSHVCDGVAPRIRRRVVGHFYDGVVGEALDEETALVAAVSLPEVEEVVID